MPEILARFTLRMPFAAIIVQRQLAAPFGLVIQGLIILAITYPI